MARCLVTDLRIPRGRRAIAQAPLARAAPVAVHEAARLRLRVLGQKARSVLGLLARQGLVVRSVPARPARLPQAGPDARTVDPTPGAGLGSQSATAKSSP